ncbi:MAG: erythromycin esterase family protein [Akkermansiaceae bacterium]|nr:erythromycin esterase family protein [Akkermansiaceae bacterium]
MESPPSETLQQWMESKAEPFDSLEEAALDPLLERIGDARVVLIGEASHGTAEFYRMRQRITAELIRKAGFRRIGIEGDWPDVERVDEYVRGRKPKPSPMRQAFQRFPDWMWRNREVLEFVDWLEDHNRALADEAQGVGIHGLDLYSLYGSIHEVLGYLQRNSDPQTLEAARAAYANLLAYEPEPQAYGQAVEYGIEKAQESELLELLGELMEERLQAAGAQKELVFDAEQNARVAANAEAYYRSMFRRGRESWNLRDSHMFETLQMLMELDGEDGGKAIVWAHNSHLGDARFTEMSRRGEHNIGQLAREEYGDAVYSIGFGTHTGTVAAADDWDEPVEIKNVNPSMEGSHEQLCHRLAKGNFLLPLREARKSDVGREPMYERAIGVIYRPHTEFASHYFKADLPGQFDEYIWFEESQAVTPLGREKAPSLPQGHPFALVD